MMLILFSNYRDRTVTAIDEYVAHHNSKLKPFIWTASARNILQKVIRVNSRLGFKWNGALH